MSDGAVTPAGDATSQPVYAGWPRRVAGFVIDMIPYLVIVGLAQTFFTRETWGTIQSWTGDDFYQVYVATGPSAGFYILQLVGLIYLFANKGLLEGATGRSIGKRLTGMVTVREDNGQVLGTGRGLLRALLVYIEYLLVFACCIGLILWLWPLWEPRRQALFSDRGTGAVVIRS